MSTASDGIAEFIYHGVGGNLTPARTISAADSAQGLISSLALDTAGNLYASYLGPPGKIAAWGPAGSGDAARAIINMSGTHKLNSVRVDRAGQVYAATDSVLVFAAGATGTAAPVRTITLPFTQSSGNAFLDGFDAQGNLYVTSAIATTTYVNVYDPGANGAAAPLRTIAIDAGQFPVLTSSGTVDQTGHLYFPTNAPDQVLVFDGTAPSSSATPLRTIGGVSTLLFTPNGIAFDSTGTTYVADLRSDQITVYTPAAAGNIAPAAVIGGPATQLHAPESIVVSP
ncbi:MAG: hypothetical protein ABR591_00435 [Candidatus Velthaea sp.]